MPHDGLSAEERCNINMARIKRFQELGLSMTEASALTSLLNIEQQTHLGPAEIKRKAALEAKLKHKGG